MDAAAVSSERVAAPLHVEGVHKIYDGPGGQQLHVLRGVNLTVAPGEAVAIIGASGAGKSTLLHIIGALDLPTEGEVRLGGTSVRGLEGPALAALRNRQVGFVFQFHHLLKEFTALENVLMPRLIAGGSPAGERARALELLAAVGLSERADHKPNELSGGEQQRVAVARALANDPPCSWPTSPRATSITTRARHCTICSSTSASARGRRWCW